MTREEQKKIVEEQFAIDYNCKVEDFQNKDTLVTLYKKQEGARKFDDEDSLLSILSYNGKLVITAKEELYSWCQEVLGKQISAEWCFEANSLIRIDEKLREYGYHISQVHLFFLPKYGQPESGATTRILAEEDIKALETDERIDEAFLFDDYIKDMLGVAVVSDTGEMLAVAGATNNSDRMWQMGVNSFCEGKGYGQAAVSELAREVQKQGKVPFYDTAMSHLASQNIALRAGMVPSYCELRSVKIK
ncbi:MAG: GNAT family N-acetyltransferase [Lachnospiraceae bacterium]|nr:GNAT family N-acetyltransferase [Lachnospiraceae bacterium]